MKPCSSILLLCAFAGCQAGPEEPGEPGEPRQVRTSFAFQQYPMVQWDQGMFLILDEDPEARGKFAGTITVNNGIDYVAITETQATMDSKGVLSVPAGEVSAPLYFWFQWNVIELQLEDQDGDGVLESGTGRINGGTTPTTSFNDQFTAAPDGFPFTATAQRYHPPLEKLTPWESLFIYLGQPVSSEQLQRYRVLADGQEVPGKTETMEDGLHTAAVFVPDRFYPLGATLEVVIDGMENALGVPVTLEHEPIQVLPDPGSILSNLGYEQGLAGWFAVGDVAAVASAGDTAPIEGASMAALQSEIGLEDRSDDSRLIGYLDVPMDVTALDLSLALVAPEESLPKLATIRLYHDLAEGGYEVLDVYEFDHEAAVFEPCACEALEASPPLTRRTAPILHTIDLTALRGERVFLEIRLFGQHYTALGAFAVPPNSLPPSGPAILLVDDLKLR